MEARSTQVVRLFLILDDLFSQHQRNVNGQLIKQQSLLGVRCPTIIRRLPEQKEKSSAPFAGNRPNILGAFQTYQGTPFAITNSRCEMDVEISFEPPFRDLFATVPLATQTFVSVINFSCGQQLLLQLPQEGEKDLFLLSLLRLHNNVRTLSSYHIIIVSTAIEPECVNVLRNFVGALDILKHKQLFCNIR